MGGGRGVVVAGVCLLLGGAGAQAAGRGAPGQAGGAQAAATAPRTASELEVAGRVLLVEAGEVYVLDGEGTITRLALDGGTRFEGALRRAADVQTGQQVRVRYAFRAGDGVATRLQLLSAPSDSPSDSRSF
jgi:hypothetical protein